jgi:hypothetical protein
MVIDHHPDNGSAKDPLYVADSESSQLSAMRNSHNLPLQDSGNMNASHAGDGPSRTSREIPTAKPSPHPEGNQQQTMQYSQYPPPLQDYHSQMELLERQNKRRLTMAGQEQLSQGNREPTPPPVTNSEGFDRLTDDQKKSMLLEQQNKNSNSMFGGEGYSSSPGRFSIGDDFPLWLNDPQFRNPWNTAPTPSQVANNNEGHLDLLEDYQMKLMLLEQQDKKRFIMSSQTQDDA